MAHSGWTVPEPEPREDVDSSAGYHGEKEVELGQPLVALGVARLGGLVIECGGEIYEQVWGAGPSVVLHPTCVPLSLCCDGSQAQRSQRESPLTHPSATLSLSLLSLSLSRAGHMAGDIYPPQVFAR